MLFIGTVVRLENLPDVKPDPFDDRTTLVHMAVHEIFAGLPEGVKEVTIETGKWMTRGKDYLLDVRRNPDGTYSPTLCGNSAAVDETDEFLRYLRARKMRTLSTSLTVRVHTRSDLSTLPVADADVVVRGPKREYRMRTSLEGQAVLDNITPGVYMLIASKQHFHEDSDAVQEKRVEVLDQTCASAQIYVRSESSVRGVLRTAEGKNAANITVELMAIDPERQRKGFSPASYSFETDQNGRFGFENVFPGRYLLGTNIEFATSSAPRAYYPGRLSREGAAEILVEPGMNIEGLQFTLPDVGPRRSIRICVVDEAGLQVKGATITEELHNDAVQFGTLGKGLQSDADGCATTEGFERASYSVGAVTGSIRNMRFSDSVEIAPGKNPISVLLVVRPWKPRR